MGELIRRAFLVTTANVAKLEAISREEGVSVSEVMRRAINAYDPRGVGDMDMMALHQRVSARLKEAIVDTQKNRQRLDKTLKQLEQ